MSEELKPCPHCGNTPPLQVPTRLDGVQMELVACLHCGTRLYGMTRADAARVWNKRHDPNPWRYPSRGELPITMGSYEVTLTNNRVVPARFNGRKQWVDVIGDVLKVRAFRELPEPAPELEVTE